MKGATTIHLSPEVRKILAEHLRVTPGSPDPVRFPAGFEERKHRRQADEGLRPWFVKTIDAVCNGRPKACAVAPNIGMFVELHVVGAAASFASLQGVVTPHATLDDLYQKDNPFAWYVRLDLNWTNLGPAFHDETPCSRNG